MRTLVFFGATGNLFTRKILPALATLSAEQEFTVVALGRRFKDHASYRAFVAQLLPRPSPLLERLTYVQGDLENPGELALKISPLLGNGPLYFYLATLPSLYRDALHCIEALAQGRNPKDLFVALEKPFGRDERDFLALEESLKSVFPEEHIFYVDHYLGKGTVQNLVVLKAENLFIERLLSREFVQEVHIGVFEEEGVGERGAFYEETGAIKDIFQNHLLQLFTLLAVDIPPLCAEDQKECTRFFLQLSRERARLLSQVRLPESHEVQLGQYAGYREEVRNPSSLRETFFFFPLFLDTERWRGVPFYVASGKKTAQKRSFIEVLFHSVVTPPNRLLIEIQPEERIDLVVSVRKPQRELESTPVTLNFTYSGAFQASTPEAYEKILYDFLHHDRTLFPDSSFIQEAWRLTDRLLANLKTHPPAFCRYREGVLTPEILFREKRIPDEMYPG